MILHFFSAVASHLNVSVGVFIGAPDSGFAPLGWKWLTLEISQFLGGYPDRLGFVSQQVSARSFFVRPKRFYSGKELIGMDQDGRVLALELLVGEMFLEAK